MPRTFACLAVANLLVLVGTAALGLAHLDPSGDRHVVLAVFTLLICCLVQVVTFTYFVVTGKMLAQALHLGGLDLAPLAEAKRLKRNAMRWLAAVVTGIILVTATGAAHWRDQGYSTWHFGAGCVVILVHASALYAQFLLVARNAALVGKVLREYAAQRGSAVGGKPILSSEG